MSEREPPPAGAPGTAHRFTGPAPHADPAQFDRVVEASGPDSLLIVLASAMGPRLRAVCEPQDILQEALALAWRDRDQHRWTGPEDWRTWLVTIGRNRIRDLARSLDTAKRGGHRTGLFGDLEGDSGVPFEAMLPAGSTTPSRVAGFAERARRMEAALGALPEDVRGIVLSHLFEERTMESVAEELGISVSAAWRRFRKGAKLYAEALAGFDSRRPG